MRLFAAWGGQCADYRRILARVQRRMPRRGFASAWPTSRRRRLS
jgi:hypothetical protein